MDITDQTFERVILVVDDDDAIRALLATYLRALADTVLVAPDAKTALEIIRSRKIDVVVSDLNMPGLSGLQLLERMRLEGHAIPFVLASQYSEKHSILSAWRLGAADFIEKPFTIAEIARGVARAFDK